MSKTDKRHRKYQSKSIQMNQTIKLCTQNRFEKHSFNHLIKITHNKSFKRVK